MGSELQELRVQNGNIVSNANISLAKIGGFFPPQSGSYYPSLIFTGSVAAAALSANTIYYIPYPVPETTTFTRLYLRITTSIDTKHVVLGIYNSANGLPTSKIVAGTEITTSGTSAQDAESTISQSLTPGLYYVACVTDAGLTVNVYPTTSLGYLGLAAADKTTGRAYNHYRESRVYDGTLPTNVGTLAGSVNSGPMVTLGFI